MKLWNYALVGVLALTGVADAVAQVRVKGYTRKDGTYVAPHYRSSPNSSKYDNYSTKGNYNPYTGKAGSVDPYRQPYEAPAYSYTAPIYAPPSRTSYESAPATPLSAANSPQDDNGSSWWENYNEPNSPLPAAPTEDRLATLIKLRARIDVEIQHELEARQESTQVEVWKCIGADGVAHYLSYPRSGCESMLFNRVLPH